MFTGVTWSVSVSEVLTAALEFIVLFKEFLILGVVLILAPMLVSFFKGIMRKRGRA